MGKPAVKDIIKKADMTVQGLIDNGGYLQEEQVKTFLKMMQDQDTILKGARRVNMNSHTREVSKLGFSSRILNAAPASGNALDADKRAAPTPDKIEMVAKKTMAEVHIDYETLEDNIEKGGIENTIMTLIAERAAVDLEEMFIRGDTTSDDPFLALHDGILKRVTTNQIDAGGPIGKNVFKNAIKELPKKYFRNRNQFRFYVDDNNETEYRDTLADRQTALGDDASQNYRPVNAYGVPVVPATLMPSTNGLLTHPKNLLWGVYRDIMIETDRDIRSQVLIIVLSMRVAIQIEEEQACVLINGITSA
jgi:HK97 family phage major capsid protein